MAKTSMIEMVLSIHTIKKKTNILQFSFFQVRMKVFFAFVWNAQHFAMVRVLLLLSSFFYQPHLEYRKFGATSYFPGHGTINTIQLFVFKKIEFFGSILRWWLHDPGLPGWNFKPSSRDRFHLRLHVKIKFRLDKAWQFSTWHLFRFVCIFFRFSLI